MMKIIGAICCGLIMTFGGCAVFERSVSSVSKQNLVPMDYVIQVGAFSQVENAARLTDALNEQGLEAYYFMHKEDLYAVRFGNYATKDKAFHEAATLQISGIIQEFYIVQPDDYFVAGNCRGNEYLRDKLARTAQGFIGVPYSWGGNNAIEGFDCSGLTMAVYRLSGLNLPRTAYAQYLAGSQCRKNKPLRGDLLFFDIKRQGEISHVGIYIGEKKFVHAPSQGKRVRISSLENEYYRTRYFAAKSFLL